MQLTHSDTITLGNTYTSMPLHRAADTLFNRWHNGDDRRFFNTRAQRLLGLMIVNDVLDTGRYTQSLNQRDSIAQMVQDTMEETGMSYMAAAVFNNVD